MAKKSNVTTEELAEELGLDTEVLGYWSTTGGLVSLGTYTWYGSAIAQVPAGGARTDNVKPSNTTIFRFNAVNGDGRNITNDMLGASVGSVFKYGNEEFTVTDIAAGDDYFDITVTFVGGPDENFLAVATQVAIETSSTVLKSPSALSGIGFSPTEIPDPDPPDVPVVWTWEEVLAVLDVNMDDLSGVSWDPLSAWAAATGDQDAIGFKMMTATTLAKLEIDQGTANDLDDLVGRTEPGSGVIPGQSRWEELWGITTIQLIEVDDARTLAMETYPPPY